jgi:hypothetical protein
MMQDVEVILNSRFLYGKTSFNKKDRFINKLKLNLMKELESVI